MHAPLALPFAAGFARALRRASAVLAPMLAVFTVNAAPFPPAKLAAMDAAVTAAITAKKTPGGVLWLERDGETYHKAYGQRALAPTPEPATEDTIYDAASLTKVVATTTAIMQLVERG